MTQYHLVVVYEDVDPELEGPFESDHARDARALELKAEHGDKHGIFMLDFEFGEGGKVEPEIFAYSAGFFKGGKNGQ